MLYLIWIIDIKVQGQTRLFGLDWKKYEFELSRPEIVRRSHLPRFSFFLTWKMHRIRDYGTAYRMAPFIDPIWPRIRTQMVVNDLQIISWSLFQCRYRHRLTVISIYNEMKTRDVKFSIKRWPWPSYDSYCINLRGSKWLEN